MSFGGWIGNGSVDFAELQRRGKATVSDADHETRVFGLGFHDSSRVIVTRAGPEALAEFRLGPARLIRAYGRLPAKSPDACATTVTRAAQNALVMK